MFSSDSYLEARLDVSNLHDSVLKVSLPQLPETVYLIFSPFGTTYISK